MAQKRINFLNRDEFLEHLNELANSVTDTQQKIEIMKMIKDLATHDEREMKSEKISVEPASSVNKLLKKISSEIQSYLKVVEERKEASKNWEKDILELMSAGYARRRD